MNTQPVQPNTSAQPHADPPGGDHDFPYTWARPATTYLTYRQVVRLTILRSKLEAIRAERLAS